MNKNGLNFYTEKISSDFDDILITKRLTEDYLLNQGMKKVWKTKYLWALGMSSVLIGTFASLNLQSGQLNPLSILIAGFIVSIIYVAFIILVADLAIYFPYAGGPYAFARRGLGTLGGYLAGIAVACQFLFGTSVLLILFNNFLIYLAPEEPTKIIVLFIFCLLMICWVLDTRIPVIIQYIFTNCSIGGLILFFIGSSGFLKFANLLPETTTYPTWDGVLQALPWAVWYYFGLEGMSVVGEETKNHEKTLPRGLILVILSSLIVGFSVWFFMAGAMPTIFNLGTKYPLLYILQTVQKQDQVLLITFSAISSSIFVAGLNGFINGYSRQVYAMARAGYLPYFLKRLHSRWRTPIFAIIVPGLISILLSVIGQLKWLIFISVTSAFVAQLCIFILFFKLRKNEPALFRWSKSLFSTCFIGCALVLVIFILIYFITYDESELWIVSLVWFAVLIYYFIWGKSHIREDAPEESMAVSGEKRSKINFH